MRVHLSNLGLYQGSWGDVTVRYLAVPRGHE
jgi:hypothetical protein